jgi:hypothetical protein
MPPELHLHPDRLLAHGTTASGLAEELRAALRGAPVGSGPFRDEQERLFGAVGAAIRELAELSSAVSGAAATATIAESQVEARFRDAFGQEWA